MNRTLWILCLALSLSFGCAATRTVRCQSSAAGMVVDAQTGQLLLCRRGREVAHYPVSLGRGGLHKRRRGDRKTPVGSYPLGRPRRSRGGFYRFIPVAIPTRVGTHVGVHGPHRSFRWLGALNTWFNWTQGCVALGSDAEVDEVVRFVRRHRVRRIHIVDERG